MSGKPCENFLEYLKSIPDATSPGTIDTIWYENPTTTILEVFLRSTVTAAYFTYKSFCQAIRPIPSILSILYPPHAQPADTAAIGHVQKLHR